MSDILNIETYREMSEDQLLRELKDISCTSVSESELKRHMEERAYLVRQAKIALLNVAIHEKKSEKNKLKETKYGLFKGQKLVGSFKVKGQGYTTSDIPKDIDFDEIHEIINAEVISAGVMDFSKLRMME